MRSDAQENRLRVLAAADEVFSRAGAAGSTEDVARAAGVGVGTVFRHFPTKAGLLAAVLALRLQRLRDRARALADDPDGVFIFFREAVLSAPGKLTIADALLGAEDASGPLGAPEAGQAAAEMQAAFAELVARAQAGGRLRADARAHDVFALLVGVSRGAAFLGLDEAASDRVLALALDGLRPPR